MINPNSEKIDGLASICVALDLDFDGDIFRARRHGKEVQVYINVNKNIIRILDESSTTSP